MANYRVNQDNDVQFVGCFGKSAPIITIDLVSSDDEIIIDHVSKTQSFARASGFKTKFKQL